MASTKIRPCMVIADQQGNIYDEPELLMVCRKGAEISLPKPEELIPLPEESELFLLPGRKALGLNAETGELEQTEELAVAAFAAPAHTLTAHPAYKTEQNAPTLPLFAYGAVGFANNRFYICAKKTDNDVRQEFRKFPPAIIKQNALKILQAFPENRLFEHLVNKCALTYSCPAARNLCLGRYEAPLPVSRSCNASCIGCISMQEKGGRICASPQNRMGFVPSPEEIAEVMLYHAQNEKDNPIFSFGQGCEGEPLTESATIAKAIELFRFKCKIGTINMNTNASLPREVELVAKAGLSSIRVSLNSAQIQAYTRYYRPKGYSFDDVCQSIATAKDNGLYVSLNLLFFPGFSDTEEEYEALAALIKKYQIDCLQLRNLNIDPEYYLELMQGINTGPCIGLVNYRKRLAKDCPWLHTGYFNPPVVI